MKEFRSYPLAFYGKGSEYFKILIVNTILTVLTLGLYYPWAKEKKLKYLYGKSTFEETPFVFSGTGREMFKGFIKAIGLLVALYAVSLAFFLNNAPIAGILFLYAGFLGFIPLALHGAFRYRMAKTSWKGIRFGYTGNRKELIKLFFKGLFLTLITFGIYGAWFTMNLRRYLLSHVQVGNARFSYTGEGDDFFWLNVKGYFLSLITLGIYFFWWKRNLFAFFVNNLRIQQEEDAVFFESKATAGGFARLLIVNLLILVFTLGLGYAWTVTRTMEFIFNNIEAKGYYSFESLLQSQEEYSDATGEDMADILDVGIV